MLNIFGNNAQDICYLIFGEEKIVTQLVTRSFDYSYIPYSGLLS